MSRPGVLREAAAALLFFGALAQQPELHRAGREALNQLAALGYRVPGPEDPVRVFPALTGGEFDGRHAGGWRPGVVYLRQNPQGGLGEAVYLRHELFHEASHRSCGGRLPQWAEEAAAMNFGGELAGRMPTEPVAAPQWQELRENIRRGANLRPSDLELLARWVTREGWPAEPCAVPPALAAALGTPFDEPGSTAYLLMSLPSARILEAGGDQTSRFPPGSLLKIPYAAALRRADPETLGQELAASDTEKLLLRKDQFDIDRYRLLLYPLANRDGEASLRSYLGERDDGGGFPFEAALPELGRTLRAALLSRPEYFPGLSRNGSLPGSTLAASGEAEKNLLLRLNALAKTGTVSDPRGSPLVGHLMVAWPVRRPVFLALFRQRGVAGAGLLNRAAPLLEQWQNSHPLRFATVRVRLLSLLPRSAWEVREECPALDDGHARISLCGDFRIVSSARGSRPQRWVSGILHEGGGAVVLETDAESYADAVLAAEAQELKGSAKAAARAVMVWNGSRGGHRHADSASLCDTTHCQVFLGSATDRHAAGNTVTDPALLALLDRWAADAGLEWLPFAAGGDERWERRFDAAQLAGLLGESQTLEILRERRRDGSLYIHLLYPGNEEVVSCEIFRNTLKLPSCPDSLGQIPAENLWWFSGLGAGHGLGMSIARAKALAEAGRSAEEILRDAYRSSR